MDKNNPLELFLNDDVQKLLDNFAGLLDLRVTFYSRFGLPIRRGRAMPNTAFCQFIQEDLGQIECCRKIDGDMREKAAALRSPVTYTCHAGLCEVISPVIIGGRLAGYLMVGQFRTTDRIPACALAYCRTMAQREALMRAFEELPKVDSARLDAFVGMFQMLIDYIAARELATLQPDEFKQSLDAYIEAHYTEELRLADMAKALDKSISSIAQYLRNKYHTCFKELLIERRLVAAEEYWKKHPSASIRECAAAAGFKDQFYFSRIFRKKRAMSPREFRAKWAR